MAEVPQKKQEPMIFDRQSDAYYRLGQANLDNLGLNPSNCTIHVSSGASGWEETWCGCWVIQEER